MEKQSSTKQHTSGDYKSSHAILSSEFYPYYNLNVKLFKENLISFQLITFDWYYWLLS